MLALRQSTPQEEGVMQVSKWLKVQALLDVDEMRALMTLLAEIYIAVVSKPVKEEEALLPPEVFLASYATYIQTLKEGRLPDDKVYRHMFSCIWTKTLEVLYAMPVGNGAYLVKAIRPTIQLQAHQFFYSTLDGKFHPMVLGQESVSWGVQFAYPQIYQDPKTKQIAKVEGGEAFPNTHAFAQLTRWMRDHTLPTPFIVEGKRSNVPMRLGRRCLEWIDHHPQLKSKGIGVYRHAQ